MPQRFRATDAVKRGGGGASPLAARSGWLGLARPLGGFHPIRALGQAAEAAGHQIDRVDPAAVPLVAALPQASPHMDQVALRDVLRDVGLRGAAEHCDLVSSYPPAMRRARL